MMASQHISYILASEIAAFLPYHLIYEREEISSYLPKTPWKSFF